MNTQQIFDKVATHLLTQNKPSRDDETCMYRGPDGLKCAVGALIADEHYDPVFERKVADDQNVLAALEKSGVVINEMSVRLLERLQTVHDCYDPEDWPARLTKAAAYYNLDTSVIPFLQGTTK